MKVEARQTETYPLVTKLEQIPGVNDPDNDPFSGWAGMNTWTGYIPIESRKANNGKLFYWFVEAESEPEKKPLMLWLNGGPGCASMIGLFEQNGPFRLKPIGEGKVKTEGEVYKFENSWHKKANMIYIDSPVGAGFSIIDDALKGATSAKEAAQDLVNFFKQWLEIKEFAKYKNRDFYVAGESYAGKYIPSFMYEFDQYNKQNDAKVQLNWKGTLIGNGMMKPSIQYPVYAEHAYAFGIQWEKDVSLMNNDFHQCLKRVNTNIFDEKTDTYCQGPFSRMISQAGGLDPFDVRQNKEQMTHVSNKYMIHWEIAEKSKIGVIHNRSDPPDYKYKRCNPNIGKAFSKDKHQDLSMEVMNHLLDHPTRKLLIYSGQFDLRVDSLGTSELLRIYPFSLQTKLSSQPETQYISNNHITGQFKQAGNITFAIIYGASHLTDEFHPQMTLQMVDRFISRPDGGICADSPCPPNVLNSCPNRCSGDQQGTCSTHGCVCLKDYSGADCSIIKSRDVDTMDPIKLPKRTIVGRNIQFYRFRMTNRFHPLMKFDAVITSKSGRPMLFLNVTDYIPPYSIEKEQLLFKYKIEMMRSNPNGWRVDQTGFQFGNLSLPSYPVGKKDAPRVHLSANVVLSSFKENWITIGVYNDDDATAEFDLELTMSIFESNLPSYWFFFGGAALCLPVSFALVLLIARQSRMKQALDTAAPYKALINNDSDEEQLQTAASNYDSNDDLELASYSRS